MCGDSDPYYCKKCGNEIEEYDVSESVCLDCGDVYCIYCIYEHDPCYDGKKRMNEDW